MALGADDDVAIRQVLKLILESFGHSELLACDGEQAVALLAGELQAGRRVVAASLDLTVPGGKGGETAVNLLHDLAPGLPVFASSGYSENAVMAMPRAHGFVDSLAKPTQKAQLAALLARHLPQRD